MTSKVLLFEIKQNVMNDYAKPIVQGRSLLLAFVCFVALLLAPIVDAQAQVMGKHFSISFKDKPVAAILDFLAKKGDYAIHYTDDVKNDTLLLTISLEDVDELSAVERLLPNTAFTYRVEGKRIEVYKMQQAVQGKFTLQGVVKDKTGETVPFATLQIKGTTQGTTADADGKFSLAVNQ